MSDGAAGFDIAIHQHHHIKPGHTDIVSTGLAFEIPKGYEIQIRQRSGLSVFAPNYLANGVGTIDSDYRGEILLPIVNNTNKPLLLYPGDRVAQGFIKMAFNCWFEVTDTLSETKRGADGFGSTDTQEKE